MIMLSNSMKRSAAILATVCAMFIGATTAVHAEPKHKIVIQVSSNDEQTQQLALNNAVNLQKEYGPSNIAIEVVAYGPGLSLLTSNSTQADRVQSLATQDITFSACANTMKGVTKKTGKEPKLIGGVKVVPAGVGRILELQEQGYAYLRP